MKFRPLVDFKHGTNQFEVGEGSNSYESNLYGIADAMLLKYWENGIVSVDGSEDKPLLKGSVQIKPDNVVIAQGVV